MNESVYPGELLENFGAKTPELNSFLDTKFTYQLAQLPFVVVLPEESGPHQNGNFLTLGKRLCERLQEHILSLPRGEPSDHRHPKAFARARQWSSRR